MMASEKRLIDANKLENKLQEHHDFFVDGVGGFRYLSPKDKARVDEITNCIAEIGNAPTVDAVEVVRCENCQYWNPRYETMGMCMKHNSIVTFTKPDFYCAWGKGKNDGICKED